MRPDSVSLNFMVAYTTADGVVRNKLVQVRADLDAFYRHPEQTVAKAQAKAMSKLNEGEVPLAAWSA